MNTFSLKIISCGRVFYDGQCEILVFPSFDGEMAVMAHHESMSCVIETGIVKFRKPGEDKMTIAIVSSGLLCVEDNVVTLLVYSAEKPEEIDRYRAEESLEKAREQLQQTQSIKEYNLSTATMARAMARLRGIKEVK